MKNCLVTNLKGVVNNDNLEESGVFKLVFKHPTTTTGYTTLRVNGIEKAEIVEGNSEFIDRTTGNSLGDTVTKGHGIDNTNDYFCISNAVDCVIACYSRYNLDGYIAQTSLTSTDAKYSVKNYKYYYYLGALSNNELVTVALQSELSNFNKALNTINKNINLSCDVRILYYPSGTYVPLPQAVDSLSAANKSKIVRVTVVNKSITGKISTLAELPSLGVIYLNNAQFTVEDELKSIGSLTNLTSMTFGSQSKVKGSLEEFVQAQIAAGRTTGEIALPSIQNTKVTWKGSKITGNSSAKVSWTASAITYYADGSTPDVVNI